MGKKRRSLVVDVVERRRSMADRINDKEDEPNPDFICNHSMPVAIQVFLWQQVSPFTRPKLGKHHEVSCMSFEKVLVQNNEFGLSVNLTEAIRSIPRWRFIQSSFPYIMHCTASLLHNRKDTNMQGLGAAETKLLYILHWIILDAAEECADDDFYKGIFRPSPFYYLFSIPSITLFIYLFAPLCHQLKESDLQPQRLENGLKIWRALWEYRHPDALCFTAHCKPKPRSYFNSLLTQSPSKNDILDYFSGHRKESSSFQGGIEDMVTARCTSSSPPFVRLNQMGSFTFADLIGANQQKPSQQSDDDAAVWVSSPKDQTVFPETIPEESSSTEEEHVVIFRLPSLTESDGLKKSRIYTAEPSLFNLNASKKKVCGPVHSGASCTTSISGTSSHSQPSASNFNSKAPKMTFKQISLDRDSLAGLRGMNSKPSDVAAATFMDVAVLRCLFITQWSEEGVYWALQFIYHRLIDLSEEILSRQQPRGRSNSLPTPKIQVPFHQSPETLKIKENKDFIEVPEPKDINILAEVPYRVSKKPQLYALSRGSSEKIKKKKKIADLKAFVETKLLSKSEKALEKIGNEETKSLCDQEFRRSLDHGEDSWISAEGGSSLIRLLQPCSKAAATSFGKPTTNLTKGKSMPSLRYIGDTNRDLTETWPNPIITVTEHTPAPSPDFITKNNPIEVITKVENNHRSWDGETHCKSSAAFRRTNLKRSKTDSNIVYSDERIHEVSGSTFYITKDGDLKLSVIVQAVHCVSLRENVSCTLRVCEVIFNLVELLITDLKVLEKKPRNEDDADFKWKKIMFEYKKEKKRRMNRESGKEVDGIEEEEEEELKIPPDDADMCHELIINAVLRVIRHLGCPHGCNDGIRSPPADFLRSQGQAILAKLHRTNQKLFAKVLQNMVFELSLCDLIDTLHAYLGFCVDPSSLLSPLNQKRSNSKSPDQSAPQPQVSSQGYATNFGVNSGTKNIEGQFIRSIFKTLVTRLVKAGKDLKTLESMVLYCDVRQLMTYVKEAHGGVFRRVALSGIIETAVRPHRKEREVQTTRVIRHFTHPDQDLQQIDGDLLDERDSRKLLFKKRSTSSTCASLLENDMEVVSCGGVSKSGQSPLRKRHHHILTPRHSERNLGLDIRCRPPFSTTHDDSNNTFRFQLGGRIVNWFKRENRGGRSDSLESQDGSDSPPFIEGMAAQATGGGSTVSQHQYSIIHFCGKSSHKSSSGVSNTLQRAKRRMEDHFNRYGFGRGKKKDGSVEETQGSYLSRRNSLDVGGDHTRDSEFIVLKERRLVSTEKLSAGMLRFSFLLETCSPGSIPDPYLLSATLDLPNAPVVSRACFLLECAYFVHCCNKGQWPAWIKQNFPMFRPSGPLPGRNAPPPASRRIHNLQRSAGKMFYQWAEAIGTRLEEMFAEDKQNVNRVVQTLSDENKQNELLMEDEEEDFLDESAASCNAYGADCPYALRLIACMLLLEITAFLRETYQSLPKSSRSLTRDRPAPWERIYSREANRRWSMALSSMGHSQTSAQSLQSIAGDRDIGLSAERKISFVLHEPDNESEGSSNTTVTVHGEDVGSGGSVSMAMEDKKSRRSGPPLGQSRPFLFRRGTNTGANTSNSSNTAGSFKRRSLKLRRGTKEGQKEMLVDTDCNY